MYPLYNLIFNGLIPFLITGLPIIIFYSVVYWKLYKKAGKSGWSSLIPIVNAITLLEIAELPWWYLILSCLPIVNIYVNFKLSINLAHKFGKSTIFGIALMFFPWICFPILAFSKKAKYDNGYNETLDDSLYQPTMNYNQLAQVPINTQTMHNTENVVQVQNTSVTPVQPMYTEPTPIPNAVSQPTVHVQNEVQTQSVIPKPATLTSTPVVEPQPVHVETPVFTQTMPNVENVVPVKNTPIQPMYTEPTPIQSVVSQPTVPVQNVVSTEPVIPQSVTFNKTVMTEQNNNNQTGQMM